MKIKGNTIRISVIFIFVIVFLFCLIIWKITLVALNNVVEGVNIRELADSRVIATKKIYSTRGTIYDNQGEPVFTSSINLFQGSTRGYTHLGIIIDYNIDSLEYLYAFFLGHRFLNAGLGFICDWSMEV